MSHVGLDWISLFNATDLVMDALARNPMVSSTSFGCLRLEKSPSPPRSALSTRFFAHSLVTSGASLSISVTVVFKRTRSSLKDWHSIKKCHMSSSTCSLQHAHLFLSLQECVLL
ncbi:hypothetical protein EDEG_04208 [Edhazardia aedis USNM 41457]|uniref:Uncharacterized protein n=1 Tax=Edhazardia aedis (strain USNM 41457) TaxID=1003232 RepID=J9DPV8_EDHAE|nr:hypothetical protein EDEG_04208 [Edhazardia aedis USNM 41457]|eukprot:EJW04580.1 hypothetical protein EDEG_04208 [Edhazardia aedis USNM 41457]